MQSAIKRVLLVLLLVLVLERAPAAVEQTITNGRMTNSLNANNQPILNLNLSGSGLQPLDADLTSLAAASQINKLYYRSASGVWSPVTIGANISFSAGVLAAAGGGGSGGGLTDGDFGDITVSGAGTVMTVNPGAVNFAELAGSATWAQVSKSGSSLADLATRSAADLNSGTLPLARLSGITNTEIASGASISQTQLSKTGALLSDIAGTAAERGLSKQVYISARTDGKPGTGTPEDPLNAGGATPTLQADALHAIWATIGANTHVYFAQGQYYMHARTNLVVPDYCEIEGAGMELTTISYVPNAVNGGYFHKIFTTSGPILNNLVIKNMTLSTERETQFGFTNNTSTCTVNAGTDTFTSVGHRLVFNTNFISPSVVRFRTTGALPGGLVDLTNYFVISEGFTVDAFKVSLTAGGPAVDITSAGTGTLTLVRNTDLACLFINARNARIENVRALGMYSEPGEGFGFHVAHEGGGYQPQDRIAFIGCEAISPRGYTGGMGMFDQFAGVSQGMFYGIMRNNLVYDNPEGIALGITSVVGGEICDNTIINSGPIIFDTFPSESQEISGNFIKGAVSFGILWNSGYVNKNIRIHDNYVETSATGAQCIFAGGIAGSTAFVFNNTLVQNNPAVAALQWPSTVGGELHHNTITETTLSDLSNAPGVLVHNNRDAAGNRKSLGAVKEADPRNRVPDSQVAAEVTFDAPSIGWYRVWSGASYAGATLNIQHTRPDASNHVNVTVEVSVNGFIYGQSKIGQIILRRNMMLAYNAIALDQLRISRDGSGAYTGYFDIHVAETGLWKVAVIPSGSKLNEAQGLVAVPILNPTIGNYDSLVLNVKPATNTSTEDFYDNATTPLLSLSANNRTLSGAWNIGAATGTSLDLSGNFNLGGSIDVYDVSLVRKINFNAANGFNLGSGQKWAWYSSTDFSGSPDTGLARNAAGVVEVNNGTTGTFRDLKVRDLTVSGTIIAGGPVRLKSYTVSTLPAGTVGDTAYVTDATAPTYLGALTGGGAVKCPVFYNGSAWVSH